MQAVAKPRGILPVKEKAGRFWEIDVLRGIAVLAMIAYHQSVNLELTGLLDINVFGRYGIATARSIGSCFLLLVGVSLYIGYSRALQRGDISYKRKTIVRGIKLLCWGMVVTVATGFALSAPAYFGVLHLIGTSVIFSMLFIDRPKAAGIAALIVFAINIFIPAFTSGPVWLLPLGIVNTDLSMADYYPLVPWFGMVLAGIYLGSLLYKDGRRSKIIGYFAERDSFSWLGFIGRNSLVIYLIHQPLLYGVTLLIYLVSGR